MGLLKEAKVLEWSEMTEHIDSYKKKAIQQFINIYNDYKRNSSIPFYWGYEMEYMLLKKEDNYQLNLIGNKLIRNLERTNNFDCWKPEYANWMIEKTPIKPYNSDETNIIILEEEIKNELNLLNNNLNDNEYAIMLSSFPLLGVNNINSKLNIYSNSTMISDNVINPHIRFKTLTKNIRERKNKKVEIKIPIYKDMYTRENEINMDCMAFGMGCCCSQITIQAKNLDHATMMYDQFAILSPILLALSSSCAILKGRLSNNSTRWNVIEQAVDDRNENDRAIKSRYSSISYYTDKKGEEYNDIENDYDLSINKLLENNNIPTNISKHVAHLFLYDPILMYQNDLEKINNNTDFFVNINSSNWNNVRLKPPLNKNDSWKVEVRVFDIQLSVFQNSSLIIFTLLLAKTLSFYNLDLYLPISLVDKNFKKANAFNSIKEKYYFKKFWDKNKSIELTSINDIIENLLILINKFLNETNSSIKNKVQKYLNYIKSIANEEEKTNSIKIYEFVKNHKNYKNDSKINNEISNDFLDTLIKNLEKELN